MNDVRVVVLYLVLVRYPAWFVPLHASLISMLIIALSAMFYLWWTRWALTPATHVAD